MKRMGCLKTTMLLFGCAGTLVPAPVVQAEATYRAGTPQVVGRSRPGTDVELYPGGVLLGRVVDADRLPMASAAVSLRHSGREVATTVTDRLGNFRVDGLRGGVYEIVSGSLRGVYRVWAHGTAPPSVRTDRLATLGGRVLRGQDSPIGYWLQNPWVIAGIVAVAVAVPVAIHNNRLHRSASP